MKRRKGLLEDVADRRRVCVLLRADGFTYDEIAEFLGITPRLVRHDLDRVVEEFPGVLDHRRKRNQNRIMRLVYLLGYSDAGGDLSEATEMLDLLVERSKWLRVRMDKTGEVSSLISKKG